MSKLGTKWIFGGGAAIGRLLGTIKEEKITCIVLGILNQDLPKGFAVCKKAESVAT